MQSSDSHASAAEIEPSETRIIGARPSGEILSAMSTAISLGDAEAAESLLSEAQNRYPGDSAFAQAILKCKVIINRREWLDAALNSMRGDLEEDRFASALGHFREALGLSRGLPLLKTRVNQVAERCSKELLPHNWRIAETILQEVSHVEPAFPTPPELQERLNQARYEGRIIGAVHTADSLEQDGRVTEARKKLEALLAEFPKEQRLIDRIYALDHPELVTKPELVVQKPASAVASQVAICRPGESELDTEGTLIDPPPAIVLPWRTKISISNKAWNVVKNLSALAATTAMLGAAGFLVWQHVTQPRPKTSQVVHTSLPIHKQPVSQPQPTPPAALKTPLAGNTVFQDVPAPPSDQDAIVQSVRIYASSANKQIADKVVDEIAIKGNEASVRYRPVERDVGGVMTFSLIRQSGVWKVKSVE